MVVVFVTGTFRELGFVDGLSFFEKEGFLLVRLEKDNSSFSFESLQITSTFKRLFWKDFVEFATENFQKKIAVDCSQLEFASLASIYRKRPFFCTVFLERPMQKDGFSLEDHLQRRHLKPDVYVFYDGTFQDLDAQLKSIDFEQLTRPNWKDYFVQLAHLSSRRSNCMKRRVGCIIEKAHRVIATGYNGTPQGMKNCFEGGCARCNNVNVKGGERLDECFCIHAEENALLECGRNASGATLYCTSCPCIGCTKKIVQCGIRKVVYCDSYHMDRLTVEFLDAAGITLEKYQENSIGQ